MSLFVVQHQHSADVCTAGHPQMGPMLIQHISTGNAAKFGIKVHGEAVLDGRHTFHLILEAGDADKAQEFMSPFAQVGGVEIGLANQCETVVARAQCQCLIPKAPELSGKLSPEGVPRNARSFGTER